MCVIKPCSQRPIRLHSTQSLIFWKCSELGDWQETGYRWVESSRIVRVFIAPEALLTLLRSDLTQLNWSVQFSWVALGATNRALRSGQARDRRLLYGNERSAGRFIASNRTTRVQTRRARDQAASRWPLDTRHSSWSTGTDPNHHGSYSCVCVCVCVCYINGLVAGATSLDETPDNCGVVDDDDAVATYAIDFSPRCRGAIPCVISEGRTVAANETVAPA